MSKETIQPNHVINLSDEQVLNAFVKLQARYKLKTPQEIQMHILWIHIKQLCVNSFGEDSDNLKVINLYDQHWKQCELASLKQSDNIKS